MRHCLSYLLKVLLLAFSFSLFPSAEAQQKPVYDTSKNFYDYQRKMNAYFAAKKEEARKKEAGEENEDGEYKQWKRTEWYYYTRLGHNGRPANMQELKKEAIQNAVASRLNNFNQPEMVSGSWSQVGPASITNGKGTGRVNRLAFLNSDANTIFAATAGGGLWKTTNGGTSWSPLTDGLPNSNLSGVAVHQTNPNIIYILTGDGDGGGPGNSINTGKFSTGVLKTTDGGVTWNYTGLKWNETDNHLAFKLIMHPSNFNILMAATDDGVYRTTNGGSSWTQVLQNETFYDIEFMPNNPLVVYAAAAGGRLYKSTDQGVTWTLTYSVLGLFASRTSIAVSPANSSVLYMLVSNNSNASYTYNGLYYSDNTGEPNSWTMKSSQIPNVFSGDGTQLIARQQSYNHSLAISPFDKDKLFTGAISIFNSTDGGVTMNYLDNDIVNYHVDIHELSYGPSGALFAACDGGVFRTTNDGSNWTQLTANLTITQYYRISVSDDNSSYILGGAQDNGSHFRNISSSVFQQASGKDGTDNAISPSNSSVMYTGSNQGDFYRTTNATAPFSNFCNPATLSGQNITATNFWITSIQVSPTNANLVYMGYQPIVKGLFSSSIWTFTDVGTITGAVVSGRTFLLIAPSNGNILYAGDNDYNSNGSQKIWRTTDGGSNWNTLTIPFTDQPFTGMTMNPDDPNELFLVYGGYSAGNKVFHSTNAGSSWTAYTGSLPNIPVNCIVYDDNNGSPADALYIGTDIGVFYRDNTLGDWIPFSNGMPVVEVTDLEINETAGLLRAGTYGRGIWQTSLYNGSCTASYTLSGTITSEPRFISAGSTITSTVLITGAGAHIQYKAGQRVTLNPGFRIDANSGAKFIGYLGPCPGGGVPPVYLRSGFNGLPGYLKE